MARAERPPRRYTAQLMVSVTPEMYAAVREQATARGCSMADLVREALEGDTDRLAQALGEADRDNCGCLGGTLAEWRLT